MSLNGLSRALVLLVLVVCWWTGAADEQNGLPTEVDGSTPSEEPTEGLFSSEGIDELIEVSKVWLEAAKGEATLDSLKAASEKIIKGIRTAADFPHDIFGGLRIFATTWGKAAQMTDEAAQLAAFKKALALRRKFDKAIKKLEPKISDWQETRAQEVEAMKKAMAFQKAAEESKKAKEEEAKMEDMDDDLSKGKDSYTDLVDDEF